MVHIRVSFETMLERINKRGREYEQLSFDPTLYDYYQELNLRYDQWYEEYQESPKSKSTAINSILLKIQKQPKRY